MSQSVEEDEKEYCPEKNYRSYKRLYRNVKAQSHFNVKQSGYYQIHKLIQQYSARQAYNQAYCRRIEYFDEYHGGNMPFFHTQNIVKSEFLFAPLYQKAVGIEKEYYRKNSHRNASD